MCPQKLTGIHIGKESVLIKLTTHQGNNKTTLTFEILFYMLVCDLHLVFLIKGGLKGVTNSILIPYQYLCTA